MKPKGHTETAIQRWTLQHAWNGTGQMVKFEHGEYVTLADHIAALQQANERMESALNRIADWCKAYPVENFKEPDWEDVKRLLGAELLTQVSAANMRHVVNGIAKIVSGALAEAGR